MGLNGIEESQRNMERTSKIELANLDYFLVMSEWSGNDLTRVVHSGKPDVETLRFAAESGTDLGGLAIGRG